MQNNLTTEYSETIHEIGKQTRFHISRKTEKYYVKTVQTTSFIKIEIFDDAQLFIVKNKNLFVMWHSNILKHKIFIQGKPPPVSMLQQNNFNRLTDGDITLTATSCLNIKLTTITTPKAAAATTATTTMTFSFGLIAFFSGVTLGWAGFPNETFGNNC